MPICVYKISERVVVEKRTKCPDKCLGHIRSIEDAAFVILNENNSVMVCQQKKSEWMKQQIKNGNSE